jgi:hypothetical protein
VSIDFKHSCVVAVAVAAIAAPLLVGRTANPRETQIQGGNRVRQVRAEPVRIHIDPIVWETLNRPDVDLRRAIAAMGIAIRDQGNRGTCSVFAMTFLLEYAYGKNFGYRTPDFSEEYLNDVKNLATGDNWDGGFFTDINEGYQKYGIVDARLDPYKSTFNPKETVSKALLMKGESIEPRIGVHFIKDWDVKTGLLPRQLSAILAELRRGIPVACGLRWPNTFATETINGIPIMKTPGPGGVFDGHSVDFVGFKADKSFPGGGYLIFRNSWGTSFQEDGYGYMPFMYANRYANDAVEYIPAQRPIKPTQRY